MKQQSSFAVLSAINVNDKVEKKDKLTYLSWAHAWAEVCKNYPDADYEIVMFNNLPYTYDPHTGYMVFTNVTIDGKTREMWLPVMDGNNKAMKHEAYTYTTKYGSKTVEAATMFDINKTLMRCLTKNLAMFGLGIYIYAGEDLPESDSTATTTATTESKSNAKVDERTMLTIPSADWDNVSKYVTANKGNNLETILVNISKRFIVSATVQKQIEKLWK